MNCRGGAPEFKNLNIRIVEYVDFFLLERQTVAQGAAALGLGEAVIRFSARLLYFTYGR
ncbi:hypothetical protein D3C78_1828560 [compost metagenome]